MKKLTGYDSYQPQLVNQTWVNLQTVGKSVLAAGCGAGKTHMFMEIVKKQLALYPDDKILILTHGSKNLRDQISKDFAKSKDFNDLSIEVKGKINAADLARPVHIALPHSNQLLKAYQYGLIVIDEGHHFYRGEMVKAILANNPKAKILIVTASHAWFTATKHCPVVSYAQYSMLKAGVIMNPGVSTIFTNQEFRNFDEQGNLSSKEELQNVKAILAQLKGKMTGKTMIACHNQKAANRVARLLGPSALCSTSLDDPNDDNIKDFKEKAEVKYLVVVYKGVIGFNFEALETIVDLTATKNVDRMYQLLGRILRFKEGKEPKYFKMAPVTQKMVYEASLSVVLALGHDRYYREWDGNKNGIRIPVKKISGTQGIVTRTRGLPEFKAVPMTWDSFLPDILAKAEAGEDGYIMVYLDEYIAGVEAAYNFRDLVKASDDIQLWIKAVDESGVFDGVA